MLLRRLLFESLLHPITFPAYYDISCPQPRHRDKLCLIWFPPDNLDEHLLVASWSYDFEEMKVPVIGLLENLIRNDHLQSEPRVTVEFAYPDCAKTVKSLNPIVRLTTAYVRAFNAMMVLTYPSIFVISSYCLSSNSFGTTLLVGFDSPSTTTFCKTLLVSLMVRQCDLSLLRFSSGRAQSSFVISNKARFLLLIEVCNL